MKWSGLFGQFEGSDRVYPGCEGHALVFPINHSQDDTRGIVKCCGAVLRDGVPYQDPAMDYEALLVTQNAPRCLRTLQKFDILVRNDDGTASVRWPERIAPMP